MKKTDSRHGQHREDLVQIAGYVTPQLKAIAQVTANELNTNMMELMRNGIIQEATRAGVMRNGIITNKYKPIIAAYVDVYNERKALNRKESKL